MAVTASHMDIEVSQKLGHGEGSMMDFIHQYMGRILKPFAIHLEELHRSVENLQGELEDSNSRIGRSEAEISTHDGLLGDLRADLTRTSDQLTGGLSNLRKVTAEKAILEVEHMKTREHLQIVDESHKKTSSVAQELQYLIKDSQETIDTLNSRLQETSKWVSSVEQMALKNRADLAELDLAHQGTSSLLGSTKQSHEVLRTEFDELSSSVKEQQKIDQDNLRIVRSNLATLKEQRQDILNRIRQQADHTKVVVGMVEPLRPWLEELDAAVKAHKKLQDGTDAGLTKLIERFDILKRKVDQLEEQFGGNAKQGGSIAELVERLTQTVEGNSKHITKLQTASTDHSGRIKIEEARSVDLQAAVSGLQDQAGRIENQIGMVDEMRKKEEAKSKAAAKLQQAVNKWTVLVRQEAAAEKIESQGRLLDDTTETLKNTARMLEQTGQRVEALEEELSTTNEKVKKLTSGLDLTKEYWKGLSQGFKETHKSVESDLLAPKASMSATLPPGRLPAITKPPSADPLSATVPARLSSASSGSMTAR